MLNTVYTIWEIHSGDNTKDAGIIIQYHIYLFILFICTSGFHGSESWIIERALDVLEEEGKVKSIYF